MLTADRQFPIGKQFITMKFHPRLDQFHLVGRDGPIQNIAIWQRKYRFRLLVCNMNVRPLVPPVISEVQVNDYSIEHRYHGHDSSPKCDFFNLV